MLDRSIEEELREEPDGADVWAGVLPGQVLVPAYLVSRFAAQYRVVVDALLEAQDRSLTGMSFDDIAAAVRDRLTGLLPADTVERLLDEAVFHPEQRLDSLRRWGVLTRWQEPARSGEDFLRRRDRYQLTPIAARHHAFWSEADDSEEDAGDMTLAPQAIHERLLAFRDAVAARRYPAAAGEFQQIIVLHHAMARAARAWQRSLAHNLSGGVSEDKQDSIWQTLRAYVSMWGEQVDVHTPMIGAIIGELEPALSADVWEACARSALSDGAPDELVRSQSDRWIRTWRALDTWFGSSRGQARRLRRQLRDVVSPWARNMSILMDTGGAVTRRAEVLRLATAIERAPTDDDAWRIWDAAVGAFSCRHLLLPADEPDASTESWANAAPAPVTARYREQGPRAEAGRRPRPPDYAVGREHARRSRVARLAAVREAEARLRQRSGTCLSEWPDLTRAELDLLLEFLSAFRRASRDGAPRDGVARSRDGRWRVAFEPPPDAGRVATLRDPRGALVMRDYRFAMEPAR